MSLRLSFGRLFFPAIVLGVTSTSLPLFADDAPLRVGIIGLDTSHVTAFNGAFNSAKPGSELAGIKIVAAFPGGSPDVEASRTRVEGFTKKLQESGVEIVDSIEALLPKVDAVLLESVDGRPHLSQAKPVFTYNQHASKKLPLFIDKPVASSLADALEIYRLAAESGTPCFSSSSLRFDKGVASAKDLPNYGEALGCITHSPCSLEEHHPDLFWYGIHGVEMLFTVMGTGCQNVSCTATKDTHMVTGVWRDGRVGTFRGLRGGKVDYGIYIYGKKGNGVGEPIKTGYEPLLVEIAKFFRSGTPPVTADETIELIAFMQAADESRRQGGKAVALADVIAAANEENAAKAENAKRK